MHAGKKEQAWLILIMCVTYMHDVHGYDWILCTVSAKWGIPFYTIMTVLWLFSCAGHSHNVHICTHTHTHTHTHTAVDYQVTKKSFKFARTHHLPFFFVSASDGTNVVKVITPVNHTNYITVHSISRTSDLSNPALDTNVTVYRQDLDNSSCVATDL